MSEEFWLGRDSDGETWLQPVFGPDRRATDNIELPRHGVKRVTIEGDLYERYAIAMDRWAGVLVELDDLWAATPKRLGAPESAKQEER